MNDESETHLQGDVLPITNPSVSSRNTVFRSRLGFATATFVFLLQLDNSLAFCHSDFCKISEKNIMKRILPHGHVSLRYIQSPGMVLKDYEVIDNRLGKYTKEGSLDSLGENEYASNGLKSSQEALDNPLHGEIFNSSLLSTASNKQKQFRAVARQKHNRKRIPDSEKEIKFLRQQRQAAYDQMIKNTTGSISIWSFESLFPEPVWDEKSVRRDLFEIKEQNQKKGVTVKQKEINKKESALAIVRGNGSTLPHVKMRSSWYGGNSMMRIWRQPKQALQNFHPIVVAKDVGGLTAEKDTPGIMKTKTKSATSPAPSLNISSLAPKVDRDLTRMVEDRVFGYKRLQTGEFRYETSLMGDGAITFRDGVRLGNPLRVNADRLNYLAKKEMQRGHVEEASEFYEQALSIDPRDGRAYLGLSRCAERRRDFKLARKWLQRGIRNSVSLIADETDRGANPFLLQAMGCLEEKMGNLAAAESFFILAAKSRPSHAAAWVSLAQIRTRKLGQPARAGRLCFQTAERELALAGSSPSSFVYTAWAALERKAGDIKAARKLFRQALDIDTKCAAAWLQLGVLEADAENWEEAEKCFTTVLKFDQRNSRVLQAYALAETRRPMGNSRQAIELFERALKVNPRDAGVLQAYALYVAKLGDIKSARKLLRRGTEVDKRHAPVWQAWGVLETQEGNMEQARKIFQEGIWACGQLTGSKSGGYNCARLWQAWGVLEAQCNDYAAARRCFSRALDSDCRNVPAITAWALVEEELGNVKDARMIFEQALKNFAAGSNEKMSLWRNYELMEQRLGDTEASKSVFNRSMREAITTEDDGKSPANPSPVDNDRKEQIPPISDILKSVNPNKRNKEEFEVVRWESQGGEIWMNDRAIESKMKLKKPPRK